MFPVSRAVIGFLKESSAYTQPQAELTVTYYKYRVYNVKFSTDIEEYKRKYIVGDNSPFSSVMGKRKCSVSFSMDMFWGGTASTAPEWSDILECCGVKKTTFTTTGISWTPNSTYNAVPGFLQIQLTEDASSSPKGLLVKIRGAMGNAKFILDAVGQPFRIDFEFQGVLQNISDLASAITPTGYQTTVPEAVLGAAVTAYTEALDLDKITLDFGNKLEYYADPVCPEGLSGVRIVDRDPTLVVDPYMATIASRGNYARMTAGTTGAFSCAIGTHLTLSAPAINIVKGYSLDERSGAAVNQLTCVLSRSSGNDEWELLQGAKA